MKMFFSTLLCLMIPLSTYAQDVRSLAVLPAQNVGLDESIAEIFNELFIAQLGSMAERRIITMRDIEAMIGFEQTKQAFDCSDMSCFAEIGGSLGVDELLYPRVTGIGDELMLSFTLMDVAKAEVLARSSITIENDAGEYREASERVLADLWKAAGLQKVQLTPVAVTQPGPEVSLEQSSTSSIAAPSTLSWVLMGTGAAFLGAGTYFGLDAQSKYDLASSREAGSQKSITEGKRSVLFTNVFIGAGALAASVGLSLWLLSGESTESETESEALSFVPFAGPDAAGVLVQGSFQ